MGDRKPFGADQLAGAEFFCINGKSGVGAALQEACGISPDQEASVVSSAPSIDPLKLG